MFPYMLSMLGTLILALAASMAAGKRASRPIALAGTLVVLALASYMLYLSIMQGSASFSESLPYPYMSVFGITFSFHAGVVQLALVIMAALVAFAAVLGGNVQADNVKSSNSLILLFELAAIGLFCSANLLVFYIFWDVGVVAGYFMIYSLGGALKKVAANTYLVYSIFASAVLLLGILMIYFYTPVHSFDISYIAANAASIPAPVQETIFTLLFIAFIIKMPIFPLHSWMPNAYAEASTQGSMLIGGVLSKFGAYGMLTLFLLLPISSHASPYVFGLATISAFYAAFVAMRQTDLKRLVAYSSMVESAIILAGISALNYFGTYGSVYLMLAHGLSISLLFLAVGAVHRLFGDTDMRMLHGIVKDATASAYTFLFGIFASTGVPLTAGFIADVLIFIGTIHTFGLVGAVPLLSIILLGAYMYYAVNRSFLSTTTVSKARWHTGSAQLASYAVLITGILVFGVFPFLILSAVSI